MSVCSLSPRSSILFGLSQHHEHISFTAIFCISLFLHQPTAVPFDSWVSRVCRDTLFIRLFSALLYLFLSWDGTLGTHRMHQAVHETIIDKKVYACCNNKVVDWETEKNTRGLDTVYIPEVHYYYTRAFVVLNVMGEGTMMTSTLSLGSSLNRRRDGGVQKLGHKAENATLCCNVGWARMSFHHVLRVDRCLINNS